MAQTNASRSNPVRGKKNARALLLSAASELMRERDSLNFTLSDIAERASVNSALVKYYFGNKVGLQWALLERDLTTAITELQELVKLDMHVVKKMRHHLAGLIQLYFRYPYLNRLVIYTMRGSSEEDAQKLSDQFFKPICDAYETLINEGVRGGVFKPVDPKLFYFTAIGSCDQIFSAKFVLKYVYNIDDITDDLKHSFIDSTLKIIMEGLEV